MIEQFRLPDLGEGLPEAELVQWTVAVGDRVALNQTIAEVETAKAVVELPSPFEGVVSALHAEAGDTILVGSVVISFDVGRADASAPPTTSADVEEPVAEKAVPNLVGYGAAPASARPRRRARVLAHVGGASPSVDAEAAVREAAPHDVLREAPPAEPMRDRPRSTPPVRKLAHDLGIDLALIAGTGESGLVTRADVEAFASRGAVREQASAASVAPESVSGESPRTTRTPIRGVRRLTADAMVRSAFTAPHVTVFLTVDVTASLELIASLKGDRALDGHRIGILALTAKAVCLALSAHPELNSAWDDAAGEIVAHHYVNLGIAAATPRGLIVPHVEDAERMTLVDLADAISELAATARAGKTALADMTGGTFTISNVGVFGVDAGTPILNPGEAGILAMGGVRRQPWEHRGEIALRDVMTLSLSFDHRLVDGEQGSRFLSAVGGVLREPGRAMLLG